MPMAQKPVSLQVPRKHIGRGGALDGIIEPEVVVELGTLSWSLKIGPTGRFLVHKPWDLNDLPWSLLIS